MTERSRGRLSPEPASAGYRPPQQERSRRVLEKVLTAAEDVLDSKGLDDFTMATVAERAGVAVGSIYARFEGKDQLVTAVKDRLLSGFEHEMAERLHAEPRSLADVVRIYTRVIAEGMAAHRRVFPLLYTSPGGEAAERGKQALVTMRQLFLDAAAPHRGESLRADPDQALAAVQAMLTSACVHRGAMGPDLWDGLTWESFADQIANMAVTYLLTAHTPEG